MSDEQTSAQPIEARDLRKRYPRGVQALAGVSFAVDRGQIFGLLGPNGAGKSTTVKILTTLARPDSGEARVAGFSVTREPDRVRHAIGCVAQKTGVNPEATGRENLILQGRLHGLGRAQLGARVDLLLERFGLSEAADRLVRGYSGGMQRKLDVALGLVHRPEVLFLDEPTTGLDPEARASMWSEIERLAHEDNITILLTTHYLEEADRLADRLALVNRGRVVVEGTPDELKRGIHGDTVQVELGQPCDEAVVRQALAEVANLTEVAIDGTSLRARAPHGAQAAALVLAALERGHCPTASVTVARPSLDDVYLSYAGRHLADSAGSGPAPGAADGGAA